MPKFKLKWIDQIVEVWESIVEAPDEAAARQLYEDGNETVYDNAYLDMNYTDEPTESRLESIREVEE
ncbi:MAG: hypothetical protein M1391_14580 [Bacteroidetes bacterium]|nr:hypothetical protein [Bacteroidota bacterium]